LQRQFLTDPSIAYQLGVAQLLQLIQEYPDYYDYSQYFYNVHGIPHVWINENMGQMYSPDDPVFWLHHSNVDRMFAFWQDCYDYEAYSSSSAAGLPSLLYGTPYGYSQCPSSDTYGLTDQMPYWYSFDDQTLTYAFPQDIWPNAYQAYFLGTESEPGWDGIQVRYGPDFMAEDFIDGNEATEWCSSNQKTDGTMSTNLFRPRVNEP